MRRVRLLVVSLALLAVGLAGAGEAQTGPDVELEPVRVDEPVAPEEGAEVPVNATVSCEGWGEVGEEAVAVYSFDAPGPEHRVRFEPPEVELSAGPGECEPGQRLDASTTLVLEPTRSVPAGSGIFADVVLRLEERSDGDVVREHGPWSGPVAYVVGLWAEAELRLEDEELELGWDERRRTEIVVETDANGIAGVEVEATSPEGLAVRIVSPDRRIHPGEPEKVSLVVQDARSAPAGEQEATVDVHVTVSNDHLPHQPPPEATATASLTVRQSAWHGSGDALGLFAVGLLGLGFVAFLHRQRRRGPSRDGRRDAPPPVPAETVPARPRHPETRSIRRAVAAWLGVLGLVALAWGTTEGLPLLAAGALSCLAAAWFATDGRLPDPLHRRLARLDPDRTGGALLAGGLATFGLTVATSSAQLFPLVAVLLVVGAWTLTRRELPAWTGHAVLVAGYLGALAPLLAEGLTLGMRGAVARIPVAGPIAVALGVWLPFLLALGVLAARLQGRLRLAAGAGVAFVLAQAAGALQLLDRRIELGLAVVQGEVLVVLALALVALPGILALLVTGERA